MRDFTVSEVLEYSRNIEKESYTFYTNISKQSYTDAVELNSIALELAKEELRHFNRISALLDEGNLTKSDMDKKVNISEEDIHHLVATRDLPENVTPLSILEIAYQRELKTESVYRRLLSFTDIAQDIVDVFSELITQEKGHASRIKSLMNNYQ